MKRIQELHKLSEEHHLGLVLSRKARMAAKGQEGYNAKTVWDEIDKKFPCELEPHFLIEEQYIAPPMSAAGETALVERFNKEHKALREMANNHSKRSLPQLQEFGELLDQHIRFEERILFERAQEILSKKELEAIERAIKRR